MKKLLMIILFYPIIAAMALTALTAETSIARGREAPPAGEPPVFSDVTVTPENVWAPAGKEVPIEVSGFISTDPAYPDCRITSMYFYVYTDNGIVASNITLGEGGSFKGTAMVNLFKDGKIIEGKTYNGTIHAIDCIRMSTLGFSVTVLHDRGKKAGLNK